MNKEDKIKAIYEKIANKEIFRHGGIDGYSRVVMIGDCLDYIKTNIELTCMEAHLNYVVKIWVNCRNPIESCGEDVVDYIYNLIK